MIIVHADHGPPAAALRPPPSASRPPHRGCDPRHGPRRPSLDGAWVACPSSTASPVPARRPESGAPPTPLRRRLQSVLADGGVRERECPRPRQPSYPQGHSALSRAGVVVTPADAPHRPRVVERREQTADDRSMRTMARRQQRYDHRLRNLVQRTADVTVATDLGVPRVTARGWLGAAPTVVVCLDVVGLTEPDLRQELGRGGPPA